MSGLERPNFLNGQVLSANDLNDEQNYFIEKQRLHNRSLHGCGVVQGLTIAVVGGHTIRVSPGLALDCLGHDIIVPESSNLKLPGKGQETFITLKYHEYGVSPIPVFVEPDSSSTENLQYSRIREGFLLECDPVNPFFNHKKDRYGWLPCEKNHGIPLAKLHFRKGRWMQSRSFSPPRIKPNADLK
jgi:hypothetical protein